MEGWRKPLAIIPSPSRSSSTQITIAAGKSLIQPIEDANVAGGSYVLTWTGTAQARAGVNTLTPSGSYAASPLLITGQTAGTVMSVEFNSGTLGTVKLESGANATPFIMRPLDQELATCKRYLYIKNEGWYGHPTFNAAVIRTTIIWPVEMRGVPAVAATQSSGGGGRVVVEFIGVNGASIGVNSPTASVTFQRNRRGCAAMTLLPKVKFKTITSFPATVLDGVDIDVVKQNGNYQFNLDFGDFGAISAIPTSPTSYVLTYDTATGVYVLVPSHLLGGGVSGIADAPNDGLLYGPAKYCVGAGRRWHHAKLLPPAPASRSHPLTN